MGKKCTHIVLQDGKHNLCSDTMKRRDRTAMTLLLPSLVKLIVCSILLIEMRHCFLGAKISNLSPFCIFVFIHTGIKVNEISLSKLFMGT